MVRYCLQSSALDFIWLDQKTRSTLRLRNDLYCVWWGVKLYSLTHSLTHSPETQGQELLSRWQSTFHILNRSSILYVKTYLDSSLALLSQLSILGAQFWVCFYSISELSSLKTGLFLSFYVFTTVFSNIMVSLFRPLYVLIAFLVFCLLDE